MSRIKQAVIFSLIFSLTSAVSIWAYTFWEDSFNPKQEHIFVSTDLFESELKIPIEFLKDEKFILNNMKNNVYDTDFKLAVFYSECAYKLLTETKNQNYYNFFLLKCINKWDVLIKKDPSMEFFKNNYLDKIKLYTVQNMNK